MHRGLSQSRDLLQKLSLDNCFDTTVEAFFSEVFTGRIKPRGSRQAWSGKGDPTRSVRV